MTDTVAAVSRCVPRRRPALRRSLQLQRLHLARDALVLEPDPAHELVAVDQLAEARGRDEHRDHVRRLLDVDRPHSRLEDLDRPRVVGFEPAQALRLLLQEHGQPLEALLLRRELRLEEIEAHLRVLDGRLSGLELRDDLGELARENALRAPWRTRSLRAGRRSGRRSRPSPRPGRHRRQARRTRARIPARGRRRVVACSRGSLRGRMSLLVPPAGRPARAPAARTPPRAGAGLRALCSPRRRSFPSCGRTRAP